MSGSSEFKRAYNNVSCDRVRGTASAKQSKALKGCAKLRRTQCAAEHDTHDELKPSDVAFSANPHLKVRLEELGQNLVTF